MSIRAPFLCVCAHFYNYINDNIHTIFSFMLWFTSILWKFHVVIFLLFFLSFDPPTLAPLTASLMLYSPKAPTNRYIISCFIYNWKSFIRNLCAGIVISYYYSVKIHLQISCVMEFNKVKFLVWDFFFSPIVKSFLFSFLTSMIIAADKIGLSRIFKREKKRVLSLRGRGKKTGCNDEPT